MSQTCMSLHTPYPSFLLSSTSVMQLTYKGSETSLRSDQAWSVIDCASATCPVAVTMLTGSNECLCQWRLLPISAASPYSVVVTVSLSDSISLPSNNHWRALRHWQWLECWALRRQSLQATRGVSMQVRTSLVRVRGWGLGTAVIGGAGAATGLLARCTAHNAALQATSEEDGNEACKLICKSTEEKRFARTPLGRMRGAAWSGHPPSCQCHTDSPNKCSSTYIM